MADKLVIIGSGGHARVVADVAERMGLEPAGFIDDNKKTGEMVDGLPVLGAVEAIPQIAAAHLEASFICAVGDNFVRAQLVARIAQLAPDLRWASIIDPSAAVSRQAHIGAGAMILPGTVIDTGVRIGRHVILNNSCSIAHDCEIGDFASAAPGVVTGGNVRIGQYSHLGVGVAVSHGVWIGAHAVIGTGSAVVRDCPDHCVAYGVPARQIRTRKEGERYL